MKPQVAGVFFLKKPPPLKGDWYALNNHVI